MIFAGADTSDNLKYVSFIIGVADDIKSIHGKLEHSNIHMRKLPKLDKERIIKNLHIEGDVFATCMYINRPNVIDKISAKFERKRRGIKRKKYVEDQYDFLFIDKVRSIYRNFLDMHSIRLESIIFEIDHDLRKAFSHLGLRNRDPSITHEIADIVAYCNSKSRRCKNIVELDLSMDLEGLLARRLHL